MTTKQNIITSDGIKLYIERSGKGASCIYLHGGPGYWSKSFQHFAGDHVEEDLEMVYLDQRGCGRSAHDLYLAERYPEIAGIMPINAAVDLPGMKDYYGEIVNGSERFVAGIGSDIKKANVEELAYPLTPVKSMGELLGLMKFVRNDLEKITSPVLIFSSDVDHVVPPDNSKEIYNKIDSKDKHIVHLENSYHVSTLDNDKELIADECIAFIKDNLS